MMMMHDAFCMMLSVKKCELVYQTSAILDMNCKDIIHLEYYTNLNGQEFNPTQVTYELTTVFPLTDRHAILSHGMPRRVFIATLYPLLFSIIINMNHVNCVDRFTSIYLFRLLYWAA